MDSPEKLATQSTQDTGPKTHHNTQTNTNSVNKTCILLQTTGGNNELNVGFTRKSSRTWQHGTKNVRHIIGQEH